MRGREQGGRRGSEDEKGASPSKNLVILIMESQPSGGLASPVPACRLPSAPRRATASATSRLKLLRRDFFFLFLFFFSILFFFFFSVKLQDDFLIPGDQNQRPGGSTPLGTAFILF